MDFSTAVRAATVEIRNQLITTEVENEEWSLEDVLTHGGWPDDEQVETITIEDEDDETVLVRVSVCGLECVPSSCHDITHDYFTTAEFEVRIHKESGDFEIELSGHDSTSEYDTEVDDIYPNDYL